MLHRLRSALLILLLPRLVGWLADALELLQSCDEARARLDSWRLAHLDEAAASAARVCDCWGYVEGRGPRVEGVEPWTR